MSTDGIDTVCVNNSHYITVSFSEISNVQNKHVTPTALLLRKEINAMKQNILFLYILNDLRQGTWMDRTKM